jgi:hypothetical protein
MKHIIQLTQELKICKNIFMNDYIRNIVQIVIVRSLLKKNLSLKGSDVIYSLLSIL